MDIPGIKDYDKIQNWIKSAPEDFIVEEIDWRNRQLKVGYNFIEKIKDFFIGEFKDQLHATLVKKNYTTQRALDQIASKLQISRKRMGYAGTKDKKAVTAQRISIWNVDAEKVKKLKMKDLILKNFEYSKKRLNLGDLQGNTFTIAFRPELTKKDLLVKKKKIIEEMPGKIPNFFGQQRFGKQRTINHLVGKALLLGDLEGATRLILTELGDESPETVSVRKFALEHWGDFKETIAKFPKYLDIELSVLNSLAKSPKDFGNALQKIPKKIRKMYIHSYQSYVFNMVLDRLLSEGNEFPEELPLIGYESELNGKIGMIIKEQLAKDGLELASFKLRRTPTLAEPGQYRRAFFDVRGFRVLKVEDNLIKMKFVLPKGCYATTFLMHLGRFF
ncbi:MAG TPA: tRNA pseudouridine(13) synthase TruD [Candidatus Woesearchaeota archaeon]|nr:tRNA pseudouridine(13) synthase TruD [Candidatus Woesearchaeota archaeon]